MKPDLTELLRNRSKIYVVNNTKPRGNIVITFFSHGGQQSTNLTIDNSSLPLRIDDQIPHAIIEESMDFRRYIAKRILLLMDETEAEAKLATKHAKAEAEMLHRSKYAADPDDKDVEATLPREEDDDDDDESIDTTPHIATTIYPEVLGILNEIEYGDLSVSDAMIRLRAIAGILGDHDYTYIIAECSKTRVRDWAKKQLMSRRGKSGKSVKKKTKKAPRKAE